MSEDGTIIVTVTHELGETPYNQPDVITFQPTQEGLQPVDFDLQPSTATRFNELEQTDLMKPHKIKILCWI